MQQVWGWDFGDLSTVTVHVRRLRGKIEDDPAAPSLIQTVWGVGYRLDPGPGPDPHGDATRSDGAPEVPRPGRAPDVPRPDRSPEEWTEPRA